MHLRFLTLKIKQLLGLRCTTKQQRNVLKVIERLSFGEQKNSMNNIKIKCRFTKLRILHAVGAPDEGETAPLKCKRVKSDREKHPWASSLN